MAENVIIDGRLAYEEDYARLMSDPEFRALYQQEAEKEELWLQLVETCKACRLTPKQVAERLNISEAQVARIEEAGYDCCTLDTLRHYVEALGTDCPLQVGIKHMGRTVRYLVVIAKEKNYGAHSPDVPGCIAVGDTFEECKASMQSALEAHIAWMLSDGDPLPVPYTSPDDPEIANDPTLTPVYIDVRVPGLAA